MKRENNSYRKLKDYMAGLVEQSTFLNDFVGYSQRELAGRDGSVDGLQSPYLALYGYELGLSGNEQNTMGVRKLNFAIMFNNVDPQDYESGYNTVDLAESLCLKVLARIRLDSSDPGHFLYNSFLKESIVIRPVELSMNSCGAEVYLELKNPQPLLVDAADWNDIDTVC